MYQGILDKVITVTLREQSKFSTYNLETIIFV